MQNCLCVSAHCPRITCPGDGFVGKDCKCWCEGSPVRLCDATEAEEKSDDRSVGQKVQQPENTERKVNDEKDSSPSITSELEIFMDVTHKF